MIKDSKPRSQQQRQLLEQLSSLERHDEMLYNILAIDVWALAKTMDEFQPGFWAAFMRNRDKALKQYIQDVVKRKALQTRQRHPFKRQESIQPGGDRTGVKPS